MEIINAQDINDFNSLKDKIEQLKGQVHIEEQALLSLKKEKASLQGSVIQLEKDKSYLEDMNANLLKDQTKLRIDNDNIQEEMVRSRTECDRIIAQSQEVSADITERTTAIELREKEVSENESVLNSKLAEVNKKIETYDALETEIKAKHAKVLEALK